MQFWKKVLDELEFQNISRKELSFKINVPVSRINRAIERDSMPSALDGLKIANTLGVSLEYLLGINHKEQQKEELINIFTSKYQILLESFEKLNPAKQKIIVNLIKDLRDL